MSQYEHNPIEFYSDAQDEPLFARCVDCGQVLDVSRDTLESLYNRESDNQPPNVRTQ